MEPIAYRTRKIPAADSDGVMIAVSAVDDDGHRVEVAREPWPYGATDEHLHVVRRVVDARHGEGKAISRWGASATGYVFIVTD